MDEIEKSYTKLKEDLEKNLPEGQDKNMLLKMGHDLYVMSLLLIKSKQAKDN